VVAGAGEALNLYRLQAVWADYDPAKRRFAKLPQFPREATPAKKRPEPAKPVGAKVPQAMEWDIDLVGNVTSRRQGDNQEMLDGETTTTYTVYDLVIPQVLALPDEGGDRVGA